MSDFNEFDNPDAGSGETTHAETEEQQNKDLKPPKPTKPPKELP